MAAATACGGLRASIAWLAEEVGELAKAARKGPSEEQLFGLGNVVAWATSLANQLGPSLEEATGRLRTARQDPAYARGCLMHRRPGASSGSAPTQLPAALLGAEPLPRIRLQRVYCGWATAAALAPT